MFDRMQQFVHKETMRVLYRIYIGNAVYVMRIDFNVFNFRDSHFTQKIIGKIGNALNQSYSLVAHCLEYNQRFHGIPT